MKYQDMLKEQLSRRVGLNPRYSLRAFANFLGLAPSKLSEILSGKKGLSAERAAEISKRLRLQSLERELFIWSVLAQHSRVKRQRVEYAKRLKELLHSKGHLKGRTWQKNAWYFGAVNFAKQEGISKDRLGKQLNLTDLQIENAIRYCERIHKLHPEKKTLSFEPMSLLKKINDDFSSNRISDLDAEFIFLSEDQVTVLAQAIRKKVSEFAMENNHDGNKNLYMVSSIFSKLCPKEDLC